MPATSRKGVAAVLNARSACDEEDATTSVAVAELAPNAWFAALTVAVSPMVVPLAVPAVTLYCTEKVPVAPAATLESVQLTGGEVQLQPLGADTETKVVLVGVASAKVAEVAAAVPVFVTTCV